MHGFSVYAWIQCVCMGINLFLCRQTNQCECMCMHVWVYACMHMCVCVCVCVCCFALASGAAQLSQLFVTPWTTARFTVNEVFQRVWCVCVCVCVCAKYD